MKKKVLLCTALVLLLLVTPAFASSYSTKIDVLCNLPDISVVVPATAEVFINPYKIPIAIESNESAAQIVSTPACIENKSKVPISVTATVTGAVKEGSDMALTSTPTEGAGTRKRAFVYFEIQASRSANQATWDSEYDIEKHLIVRTTAKTMKNIVTLDAADGVNRFGVFRLTGDCTVFPKGGWAETDGIDVEIAFTFTPLPRPGI